MYIQLASNTGSILPAKIQDESAFEILHSRKNSNQYSKKLDIKIENYNPANNSATMTIYTRNNQNPLQTYLSDLKLIF